jgi:hypothetical protein
VKAPVEKTPSVKDTLSKINSIGKQIVSEPTAPGISDTKEITVTGTSITVSEDELQIQFMAFVERLNGEQPRLYSALKKMVPKFSENQVILTFQSKTLVEDYKLKVRPSLISFLRQAFSNELLDINEIIADSETVEKPKLYSDSEKLQHMIGKNPALQKLKTRFNLDFD